MKKQAHKNKLWISKIHFFKTYDKAFKLYICISDVGMMFLNNEGSGLYNLQRCVNHSCEPNAKISFPFGNSTLQLVATRDILPGEEICISYLDECVLERSRYSRQKILR